MKVIGVLALAAAAMISSTLATQAMLQDRIEPNPPLATPSLSVDDLRPPDLEPPGPDSRPVEDLRLIDVVREPANRRERIPRNPESPAFADGPFFDAAEPTDERQPQVMRRRRVTRPVVEERMEAVPEAELLEARQLQDAMRRLKSTRDEGERTRAAAEIESILKSRFDRDLQSREKELNAVEQRVRELRDQFEKRKAAREKIVQLKWQMVMNEAEGLGFPDEDGPELRMPGQIDPYGSLPNDDFQPGPEEIPDGRPADEFPAFRDARPDGIPLFGRPEIPASRIDAPSVATPAEPLTTPRP